MSAPADSTIVVAPGSEHAGGLVIDRDVVLIAAPPGAPPGDQVRALRGWHQLIFEILCCTRSVMFSVPMS